MPDHTATLNPAQKEAVLATEGPLLVLAGAGAGKTRVITHRILEIVRRGTAPEKILAITFTNKAAAEMRERVLHTLSTQLSLPAYEQMRSPFVSTFHSLGLLIIKEHYRELGFKRLPAVYDRADSLKIIKEELKRRGENEIEPKTVLNTISREKGNGITAREYNASARSFQEQRIAPLWLHYDEALAKEGVLDFDDLLLRAVVLLREREEVRDAYRARWTHVHIDEFQDTNKIQSELARLIVGPANNVCAVGDVDQTIYTWRGAQIQNMLSFDKLYPGARTILLEENYRSTKTIIAAANDIIAKNVFRPEKVSFTNNEDGDPILLYQAFDEMDEAGFVARSIGEKIAEGFAPRDIAVLYRANFQSRALEEALLRAQVPYQVLGTRFFDRKEVKDVLSILRAALYQTSADIARAVDAIGKGIGKVTLTKMLAGEAHTLTGAAAAKVQVFENLLTGVREAAENLKPSELIRHILVESGLEIELHADKVEGPERLENVRELGNLAGRYDKLPLGEGLQMFLENAALASDQDSLKQDEDRVRLMTVHASKGLEFPVIFITGLEEGLFPYERPGEEGDKEEERRLMYVAVTRAGKKLYLCYASFRTVFGAKMATIPSSFLSDIPDNLVELAAPERLGRTIYLD